MSANAACRRSASGPDLAAGAPRLFSVFDSRFRCWGALPSPTSSAAPFPLIPDGALPAQFHAPLPLVTGATELFPVARQKEHAGADVTDFMGSQCDHLTRACNDPILTNDHDREDRPCGPKGE
ncbi:hypothetical protein SKAU_G00386080 [Synaphobranchus kaupii]|uniref:Uncharacterized protein n=1 Tax=Synaphobranchus kaupii TaxID=118154 RepID=A0A9Q1EEL8_SYNKA|nr:hypothetical protein SKAU_G00386080 [Synaphobranchus kaupii]